MSDDPDCIFCKIIRGEIPCFKLYEDDKTLAFMDINPANDGHCLVIPKHHSENLHETPAEWLLAVTATAQKVAGAVEETLHPYGLNLLQANGPGAAQSVMHLHLHIVPRAENDALKMNWGIDPGDMDAIAALAERIRANLD